MPGMRHVIALLAALLITSTLCRADEHPAALAIGSAAPDFELPGVDGKTYSLKNFAEAKVLVIIFTCNHCPTAQYYEPRIKKLVADYRDKGVAIVAISPNDPKSVRLDELGYTDLSDSLAEMKVRARDNQFNFPYLYDGDAQDAAKKYGPRATPHAFVFDKERVLRYAGRIDDSERPDYVKTSDLRNAVDALLADKEPPVPQTNNFGCSIKWAGKHEEIEHYMDRLASEQVMLEPVDAKALTALRENKTSGKLRLINFWATWCGPCVTEFPDLIEINCMYRHRAFELVTVSANFPDEKKEALDFLKTQQASCSNYIFGSKDKYDLMAAFDKEWTGALPYTLLISSSGEVLYRHEGAVDPLELKRLIVKTLKEDRFKD